MKIAAIAPENFPAVGLIEFKSIARGISATDAMLKKAPVHILLSQPISPGKFMTLVCGDVASVDESLKIGIEKAGDLLVNHLFLPQIHQYIVPALSGNYSPGEIHALGILETFSVATCIVAADIAMKTADVRLVKIRLADGLGGKAYFVLTGNLTELEAALENAVSYARSEGLLTAWELIQNPHPDLISGGAY